MDWTVEEQELLKFFKNTTIVQVTSDASPGEAERVATGVAIREVLKIRTAKLHQLLLTLGIEATLERDPLLMRIPVTSDDYLMITMAQFTLDEEFHEYENSYTVYFYSEKFIRAVMHLDAPAVDVELTAQKVLNLYKSLPIEGHNIVLEGII